MTPPQPTRRRVLVAVGWAGIAGLLAACTRSVTRPSPAAGAPGSQASGTTGTPAPGSTTSSAPGAPTRHSTSAPPTRHPTGATPTPTPHSQTPHSQTPHSQTATASPSPTTRPTTATPTPTPTRTPSPKPTTSSPRPTPPPGEPPLAKLSDIPVGGSRVVENPHVADQQIALYRGSSATCVAHSAICTHQGCTVDPAPAATLACPCHGSRFRAPDGTVINGPNDTDPSSISPLAAVRVTVVDGSVYLD